MSSSIFDWRDGGLRLLFVIAFHLVFLLLLIRYGATSSIIKLTPPIMVSIIVPPAPEVVKRPKELPKLLPVKKIIKTPPKRIITATTVKPAEVVTPPPPKEASPAPIVLPPPVAREAVILPSFHASYLDNPDPVVPALSKRLREHGEVLLRVLVNSKGFPDKVEIDKSSGFGRLDDAALSAVEHWKFVPARRGTQAVVSWVIVPISFVFPK